MRAEEIMDALNRLDEDLLAEADRLRRPDGYGAERSRRRFRPAGLIAAAAALILLGGFALAAYVRWRMPAEGETYTGEIYIPHRSETYPLPDEEALSGEAEALTDRWFIAQAVTVLQTVGKEDARAESLTVTRQTNQLWSREEAVVTFTDGEGRATETKFDAQSGYLIGVTAFDKEVPAAGTPMAEAEALAIAQEYYDALPYAAGYTCDYVEKYDDHAWSFHFDRPFALRLWGEEVTVRSDYEQVRIVIDPCTGAFQMSNCFYVPLLDDHGPEDAPLTKEEALAAAAEAGIPPEAAELLSAEIAVCLPAPGQVSRWLGTEDDGDSAGEDTALAEAAPGGERYYGLTRLGWVLTYETRPPEGWFSTQYRVAVDLYTGDILSVDSTG